MTPDEVAHDNALLGRFQSEIAYLDRMRPTGEELQRDTDVLKSKDGVLVVAWLWPNLIYQPEFDPFAAASRAREAIGKEFASRSDSLRAEEAFEWVADRVDRQRQSLRTLAARRFLRIVESTARAVGCELEDLKTHLEWSTALSKLELERLLRGDIPIPFPVIVRLCAVLQLDFTYAWVLRDPERLARRVEQSALANGISVHLGRLAPENLQSLLGKLPRASVNAGQGQEPTVYRAPEPGARYSALYEALAADDRDSPEYALDEIDRLLVDSGEERPLPSSARSDRFWWAGTWVQSEGRPQIRAWWAAGYRIPKDSDPTTGRVRFEALPGRDDWLHSPERAELLANPERIELREYKVPVPEEVPIYPADERVLSAMRAGLTQLGEAAERFSSHVGVHGTGRALADILQGLDVSSRSDDSDIRVLAELLDGIGEANRLQIVDHFSQAGYDPVDDTWMSNLLTKARRQGWIVNKGTRRQPSWAATRKRAVLMRDIADKCNLVVPAVDPLDPVPAEFLQQVAKAMEVESPSATTLGIARQIVEARGGVWQAEFESADGSVTSLGLQAVSDSIGRTWVWRTEWDQL